MGMRRSLSVGLQNRFTGLICKSLSCEESTFILNGKHGFLTINQSWNYPSHHHWGTAEVIYIYIYICDLCVYIYICIDIHIWYCIPLVASTPPPPYVSHEWLLDTNALRMAAEIHHPEAVEGWQIHQPWAIAFVHLVVLYWLGNPLWTCGKSIIHEL